MYDNPRPRPTEEEMRTKAREIVDRHGVDIASDDASREIGIYVRALMFDDGQTFAKLLASALRDQRKNSAQERP